MRLCMRDVTLGTLSFLFFLSRHSDFYSRLGTPLKIIQQHLRNDRFAPSAQPLHLEYLLLYHHRDLKRRTRKTAQNYPVSLVSGC